MWTDMNVYVSGRGSGSGKRHEKGMKSWDESGER